MAPTGKVTNVITSAQAHFGRCSTSRRTRSTRQVPIPARARATRVARTTSAGVSGSSTGQRSTEAAATAPSRSSPACLLAGEARRGSPGAVTWWAPASGAWSWASLASQAGGRRHARAHEHQPPRCRSAAEGTKVPGAAAHRRVRATDPRVRAEIPCTGLLGPPSVTMDGAPTGSPPSGPPLDSPCGAPAQHGGPTPRTLGPQRVRGPGAREW